MKTKIIILASLISTLGVFGTSFAANTELYVSPSTTAKNVGNSFIVSVNVTTAGEKVYAVEGTIALDNLNCKGITISDGMVVQSAPTCSNPYFLIGIPQGTDVDTTLFKILLSSDNVGTATVSINNVDIIDAGRSLSSTSVPGIYKITAPKPVPVVVPTPAPVVVAPTSTVATSSEIIATSSEAAPVTTTTPDNKGNSFVATVLETLSNLRGSTKFAVSALIALIVLSIGPALLRKIEEGI